MDRTNKDILDRTIRREHLTRDEARSVFEQIMSGELGEGMVGALLAALSTKGEWVDEVVGAALAMRDHAVKVKCDPDCIDTCGTGGDGISTFNASTAAAIIAAGAGACVAKHGNRSSLRVSGSTEVLTELGIDVEADKPTVERSIAENGIGYLNARMLHPAMKHAAPLRRALGVRTIFNLLGPLTNPAGARRQLLGVSDPRLLDLMAQALIDLGGVRAWVVHGTDRLCDVTITAETQVVEVRDGWMRRFVVSPEDVGLKRASISDLLVDSPQLSAQKILGILRGDKGPIRDHALLNAGAALVVSGLVDDLKEGVIKAAQAVDNGAALARLEAWQKIAGTQRKEESAA